MMEVGETELVSLMAAFCLLLTAQCSSELPPLLCQLVGLEQQAPRITGFVSQAAQMVVPLKVVTSDSKRLQMS